MGLIIIVLATLLTCVVITKICLRISKRQSIPSDLPLSKKVDSLMNFLFLVGIGALGICIAAVIFQPYFFHWPSLKQHISYDEFQKNTYANFELPAASRFNCIKIEARDPIWICSYEMPKTKLNDFFIDNKIDLKIYLQSEDSIKEELGVLMKFIKTNKFDIKLPDFLTEKWEYKIGDKYSFFRFLRRKGIPTRTFILRR